MMLNYLGEWVSTNSSMQYPLLKNIPILYTYPKDPAVSPETNHAYVCFSTMTLLYRHCIEEKRVILRVEVHLKWNLFAQTWWCYDPRIYTRVELFTHPYTIHCVLYVFSMKYMFEYSRLIMHAIEFLERWNFNYSKICLG